MKKWKSVATKAIAVFLSMALSVGWLPLSAFALTEEGSQTHMNSAYTATQTDNELTPTEDPATEQEEPATEQEQPTDEQEQPADEQEQPADEQEEPADEQEQPVAEQEQPAVEQEQPVAEQEVPAVEQEKPTAEQEVSAAEQEQPAAEQEEPAAEEDPAALAAAAEPTELPEVLDVSYGRVLVYPKENDAATNVVTYSDRSGTHTVEVPATQNITITGKYKFSQDYSHRVNYNYVEIGKRGQSCTANITFRNLDLNLDFDPSSFRDHEAPVSIAGQTNITIELDGKNSLLIDQLHPALEVMDGSNLVIHDNSGSPGSLTAIVTGVSYPDVYCSGIGNSDRTAAPNSITIENCTVVADGDYGPSIGCISYQASRPAHMEFIKIHNATVTVARHRSNVGVGAFGCSTIDEIDISNSAVTAGYIDLDVDLGKNNLYAKGTSCGVGIGGFGYDRWNLGDNRAVIKTLNISDNSRINVGAYGVGVGATADAAVGELNITNSTVRADGDRDGSLGIGANNKARVDQLNITGGNISAVGKRHTVAIGASSMHGTASVGTINFVDATVTALASEDYNPTYPNRAPAIGASNGSSVDEINFTGGTVKAIARHQSSYGIGASDHATVNKINIYSGDIIVDATTSPSGGGIGAFDRDAILNELNIMGGNITVHCCQYAQSRYSVGIGTLLYGVLKTLNITGGTINTDSGKYGAAIGSSFGGVTESATISGGTVNAIGNESAPAIGAAYSGELHQLNITGGTVNATGNAGAPGIGVSDWGNFHQLNITGGNVTAIGGENAPAIGYGPYMENEADAAVNEINITGGTVLAKSGTNAPAIFAHVRTNSDESIPDDSSIVISPDAEVLAFGDNYHAIDLSCKSLDVPFVLNGQFVEEPLQDTTNFRIVDANGNTKKEISMDRTQIPYDSFAVSLPNDDLTAQNYYLFFQEEAVENLDNPNFIGYNLHPSHDVTDPVPDRNAYPIGNEICNADQMQLISYPATFEFKSGTPDKELPAEVLALLPASHDLTLAELQSKEFGLTFDPIEADGGTWSFASWDGSDQAVDENGNFHPVHFVGTWTFALPEITVSYQWTDDCVPEGVKLPDNEILSIGDAYNAVSAMTQDGWEFHGWYTDKECTTPYVDGTHLTSDTVLYGKWEKAGTPLIPLEPSTPIDPPTPDEGTPLIPLEPSTPIDPSTPDEGTPLVPLEPSTPSETPDSNTTDGQATLPQTGLLQWPVILLLVGGALLIVVGYRMKKKQH